MRNVVAIEVPSEKREAGRTRHFIERCSGTLLQNADNKRPDLILTAWHCVENYSDLSKHIQIRFPHAVAPLQALFARIYRSGDSITSDWALLRLVSPVPDAGLLGLSLSLRKENQPAYALGFAGELRQGRSSLSFDADCNWSQSNLWQSCQSSKGSSGGPLVQVHSDEAYVVGVISQGDSEEITLDWSTSELPLTLRSEINFRPETQSPRGSE